MKSGCCCQMRIVMNNWRVTSMSRPNRVTSGIPQVTWMMIGVTVVMTGVISCTRTAWIIIAGTATTVATILWLPVFNSLAILFAFHPFILEPNFDLALCQIEVSSQLPTFLFWHVGIKKEFFLQLKQLEFWVGPSLFPYTNMTVPMLQGISEAGRRKK